MKKPPYPNVIETSFGVPADAPPAIEQAWAKFDALVQPYEDARQTSKDAPRALKAAEAADNRDNAAAYTAGKEPKDPNRHALAAEAKVAADRAKVDGLLEAIDQAGDALAEAVDTARDDWLSDAREQEATAAADYVRHVKAARAAAQRLATSRGVVRWLVGWRLVRGSGGIIFADQDMRYTGGGRFDVNTGNIRRYEQMRVVEVLDLLATAADEPKPTQSRQHKVAAR